MVVFFPNRGPVTYASRRALSFINRDDRNHLLAAPVRKQLRQGACLARRVKKPWLSASRYWKIKKSSPINRPLTAINLRFALSPNQPPQKQSIFHVIFQWLTYIRSPNAHQTLLQANSEHPVPYVRHQYIPKYFRFGFTTFPGKFPLVTNTCSLFLPPTAMFIAPSWISRRFQFNFHKFSYYFRSCAIYERFFIWFLINETRDTSVLFRKFLNNFQIKNTYFRFYDSFHRIFLIKLYVIFRFVESCLRQEYYWTIWLELLFFTYSIGLHFHYSDFQEFPIYSLIHLHILMYIYMSDALADTFVFQLISKRKDNMVL